MKRRIFIQNGAAALSTLPFISLEPFAVQVSNKPAWLVEWIKNYDGSIDNYRALKVRDLSNPFVGGYIPIQRAVLSLRPVC